MKSEAEFRTIPIMRIFDVEKAKQFYLGFLGMKIDWEHRFEPDAPVYIQVSRGELVLHLSEHSGDCTPGAKVFVHTNQIMGLVSIVWEVACTPSSDIGGRNEVHCRCRVGFLVGGLWPQKPPRANRTRFASQTRRL